MSERRSPSLIEAIEAFSLETDRSPETLRRYLADHPEHAQGLLDFALERRLLETEQELAPSPDAEAAASHAFARLLGKPASRGALSNPLEKASLKDLEKATSIPLLVLMAFRKGIVLVDTVPEVVLRKLSRAVGYSSSDLRLALCVPAVGPKLAHKAAQKPVASAPVPFEQVVSDAALSDEVKTAMLAE